LVFHTIQLEAAFNGTPWQAEGCFHNWESGLPGSKNDDEINLALRVSVVVIRHPCVN
jgi:hypothetical protein